MSRKIRLIKINKGMRMNPIMPLSSKSSSLDLLPQPFAWIPIPNGDVTLAEGGYLDEATTFTIPLFEMAKYPITNAQFKIFMDAGGYDEKRWWTGAGWQAKLDGWMWDDFGREWKKTGVAWTKPRYWDNTTWKGGSDCPVVGVSWYEAVALCNWLSESTGEKIILPTEGQWQHAAQGDDARHFPWGNEWDETRCNNFKLGLRNTTSVTQFEGLGDSPYGVTDMSGNVWEWCLTVHETGVTDLDAIGFRILRGVSWINTDYEVRVSERFEIHPKDVAIDVGFRLVRLGWQSSHR